MIDKLRVHVEKREYLPIPGTLIFGTLHFLLSDIGLHLPRQAIIKWQTKNLQRRLQSLPELETIEQAKKGDVELLKYFFIPAIKEAQQISIQKLIALYGDTVLLEHRDYIHKKRKNQEKSIHLGSPFHRTYRIEALLDVLFHEILSNLPTQEVKQMLQETLRKIKDPGGYACIPLQDGVGLLIQKNIIETGGYYYIGICDTSDERPPLEVEKAIYTEEVDQTHRKAQILLLKFIRRKKSKEEPFVWNAGILAQGRERKPFLAFLEDEISNKDEREKVRESINNVLLKNNPQAAEQFIQLSKKDDMEEDSAVFFDQKNDLYWQVRPVGSNIGKGYQVACWDASGNKAGLLANLLPFPILSIP